MEQIYLPKTNGAVETIDVPDSLVLLGANGSGKSRLGSWIERNNSHLNRHIKRVSAQRSLSLPQYAELRTYEQALHELLHSFNFQGVTSMLGDYSNVLSTLFASTAKRDSEYIKVCREAQNGITPEIPDSPIDKLIKIWNNILPHRKIVLEDNKVEVLTLEGINYTGSEMSDGERVALYLISQCLLLPGKSIIIIDEPEVHLHKALMSRLWNALEEERNDCLFIYITHDLDFAASRVKAKKIWVKAYTYTIEYGSENYDWEVVPDINSVPENLLLEIIGSRKPILFVEGEKGSYDHAIYQEFYPNYTIIPRGGCHKVIESTKGINESAALNTIKAYGIVDRDYRSQEEIDYLSSNNIFVVDVAEVENMLLTPKIIEIISKHMALDSSDTIEKITNSIIKSLSDNLVKEISFRTSLEVNYKLNTFNQKKQGVDNIKQAISELVSGIDVDSIYDRNEIMLNDIIANRDLENALRFHTNKGLLPNASRFFNLHGNEYPNLVLRLLKTEKKEEILDALSNYLPSIN